MIFKSRLCVIELQLPYITNTVVAGKDDCVTLLEISVLNIKLQNNFYDTTHNAHVE